MVMVVAPSRDKEGMAKIPVCWYVGRGRAGEQIMFEVPGRKCRSLHDEYRYAINSKLFRKAQFGNKRKQGVVRLRNMQLYGDSRVSRD